MKHLLIALSDLWPVLAMSFGGGVFACLIALEIRAAWRGNRITRRAKRELRKALQLRRDNPRYTRVK